jgi:hypothetical protein
VRGHRNLATALDRRQNSAFRRDRDRRVGVGERAQELAELEIVRAVLERQRA